MNTNFKVLFDESIMIFIIEMVILSVVLMPIEVYSMV